MDLPTQSQIKQMVSGDMIDPKTKKPGEPR
jgi:hypothetical protein